MAKVRAEVKGSRDLLIANLLGKPELSTSEIAKIVGCSQNIVRSVAKGVKKGELLHRETIEEYHKELLNLMPLRERAARYVELARQNDQKKVALDALLRIDHIHGLMTKQERLRYRKQEDDKKSLPIFVLPESRRSRTIAQTVQDVDVTVIDDSKEEKP